MKIVVMEENPQTLELTFDNTEVVDEKFETVKESVMEKAELIKDRIDVERINPVFDLNKGEIIGEEIDPKIDPIKIEPIILPPDTPQTLTITNNIKEENMGQFVDRIREEYCGDVIPLEKIEVDEKTEEEIIIKKDLSKCPMFKIGYLEEIVEKDVANIDETVEEMVDIVEVELNEKEVNVYGR